jgi:hypothetical protein
MTDIAASPTLAATPPYRMAPADMAAWSDAMQRRYWFLRPATQGWYQAVVIALMGFCLWREWQSPFGRILFGLLLAVNLVIVAGMRLPWARKRLGFLNRPLVSPKVYRAEFEVRLSADGVEARSDVRPSRSLPWSRLLFVERKDDQIVMVWRPRGIGLKKFLVVPRRAFADATAYGAFCDAATTCALQARRRVFEG